MQRSTLSLRSRPKKEWAREMGGTRRTEMAQIGSCLFEVDTRVSLSRARSF